MSRRSSIAANRALSPSEYRFRLSTAAAKAAAPSAISTMSAMRRFDQMGGTGQLLVQLCSVMATCSPEEMVTIS